MQVSFPYYGIRWISSAIKMRKPIYGDRAMYTCTILFLLFTNMPQQPHLDRMDWLLECSLCYGYCIKKGTFAATEFLVDFVWAPLSSFDHQLLLSLFRVCKFFWYVFVKSHDAKYSKHVADMEKVFLMTDWQIHTCGLSEKWNNKNQWTSQRTRCFK